MRSKFLLLSRSLRVSLLSYNFLPLARAINILAKPLSLIKSFSGTMVNPEFLTCLKSLFNSLLLSKSFLLPRGRWLKRVPKAYSSMYILTAKSSPLSLNSQKLSAIEALLLRMDLISVPVNTIPAVN